MRTRWSLVAVLAMAVIFVAVGSPAPAPAAEGTRVLMVDNEPDLTRWHYDPAQLTVPAGSTVVWFNKGKEEHSVTADDKSFDSGLKKAGASFQRAFPRPGKYAYHCEPHPWMTGTIQVVAAPTPTSAAAGATPEQTTATGPPPPVTAATTFPPSLATQPPAETPETTTSAPAPESPSSGSGDTTAAPAARKRSGGHLAGTIALVLGPTLAGLALGARLRRSKS